MSTPLGIGFVGAGVVVQSVHLPTLARLGDRFRTVAVADGDGDVAAAVAERAGARPVATIDALLAVPVVDIVALCGPQELHAAHVEAACAAGVRGVLCEKPLATNRAEAERVAEAARRSGVPIVVGAMHAHDPGWTAAEAAWGDLPEQVHTVRSEIVLPPNELFLDWATETLPRTGGGSGPDLDAGRRLELVVLALAIHDIPMVRRFLGPLGEVDHARFLPPFGYEIGLRGGNGRSAEMVGAVHRGRHTRWTFDAWSDETWLHTDFTPSFVHTGSAVTTLRSGGTSHRFGPFPANGYEHEWLELAALATGAATPRRSLDTVVDDIRFAADVAEGATHLVRKETVA